MAVDNKHQCVHFDKMKIDMLPTQVKKAFSLHWRPIFTMMEQVPGMAMADNIDAEHITATYHAGKEYLKTRVQYVFQNSNLKPMQWKISTWWKKVSYSSIQKYGTEQERAKLPPKNGHRNKCREQHGHSKPQVDRR